MIQITEMKTNIRVLAIIPARSGSKGLPGKNVRHLHGKPLLAWSIEAGQHSKCLDRIIVSTDDATIADIAREWGAETPCLRPAELAQDDTSSMAVVFHILEWLAKHEQYVPDATMLLQPTSPLRTAHDIQSALQLYTAKHADGVVSVSPVTKHPLWMKVLDAEGRLNDFIAQEQPITSRQALPPVYALNGAIYLASSKVLTKYQTWYTQQTYGYVMPVERSLDIDSAWDWHIVEILLKDQYLRQITPQPTQSQPGEYGQYP